jgi:hypothetical protein
MYITLPVLLVIIFVLAMPRQTVSSEEYHRSNDEYVAVLWPFLQAMFWIVVLAVVIFITFMWVNPPETPVATPVVIPVTLPATEPFTGIPGKPDHVEDCVDPTWCW